MMPMTMTAIHKANKGGERVRSLCPFLYVGVSHHTVPVVFSLVDPEQLVQDVEVGQTLVPVIVANLLC